jgi:hypothetical protein
MAPAAAAIADAKAQKKNAPWVELNEEKSIQKAMQVMRDYKRDDRKERDYKPGKRKRANLPRGGLDVDGSGAAADGAAGGQADGYDEQMKEQHLQAAKAAEDYEAGASNAAAPEEADAEVYSEGCTNGIVPTNADVLTGRGAFINDHPGNKFWRGLAQQQKARFDSVDQQEKKEIAVEIVRAVSGQKPTAGRFLRKIDAPTPVSPKKELLKAARAFALTPRGFQGPWEVMDEAEARIKTIQTLRDMGRDKTKSKKRKVAAAKPAAAPQAEIPVPGDLGDMPNPVIGESVGV